MRQSVIYLHPQAPPLPAAGRPCNGCGVCCTYAPCPLGMLLSRRRRGACRALRWVVSEGRYRCGALDAPGPHLRGLPGAWARRLVRRWIAAGEGCDASLAVQRPAPSGVDPEEGPRGAP